MASYDPNDVIIQMHQELENARKHIDLLTNQSRRSSEELSPLKNQNLYGTFVLQTGMRPPHAVTPWSGPLPPPPIRAPMYNLVPNNIQPGAFNLVTHVPPTHVPAPTVQTQFVQIDGEGASSARHDADIVQQNDRVAQRLKLLEESRTNESYRC